ncbi:thioesterase family protein [Streptomyces sp. L06]|nr:thioesterase family protein [Streptomyces sp. L06]
MTKLPLFHSTVRPEWIDYNGHMSEAYYSLVFGHATDALMAETGLGPAYRESTRCSLYTVESHIRFLQDVPDAAHLAIRTRVLGRQHARRTSRTRCTWSATRSRSRHRTRSRWRRRSCSRSTSTGGRPGPPSFRTRSGTASQS